MVPKSWRRAPLILVGISAALALAGGCSPHAHLGAELAASQTGCLNGIGEAIQGYWNATNLDDGKIARYAQCAHESLRLFYEKSSGSVAGQYSPGELVNFLESNEFVKPKTITPAIQLRAMELKQLLLGGSLHALTIAELKGVQEWIEKLRQINSSLKPFYVALARPDKTE
ncbi:MAG: hypothetical protein ACXVBC_12005, partial [Bdellovibrionota bacterium]